MWFLLSPGQFWTRICVSPAATGFFWVRSLAPAASWLVTLIFYLNAGAVAVASSIFITTKFELVRETMIFCELFFRQYSNHFVGRKDDTFEGHAELGRSWMKQCDTYGELHALPK